MDGWKVGLCEFTCHPRNVGTFAGLDVVSTKIAFLYCDLISPQFVGSQYVRCLRTFVLPTTYCNKVFGNVYYGPVEKLRFQDMRIELKRQTGEPPELKSGDVPRESWYISDALPCGNWAYLYINTYAGGSGTHS